MTFTGGDIDNPVWPEGHTILIDGVRYGARDIVPGTNKTFDDPWWTQTGPYGRTNWSMYGPGGSGGHQGGGPFGGPPDTREQQGINPETGMTDAEWEDAYGAGTGSPTTTTTTTKDEEESDTAKVVGPWFDEFAQIFPGYARLLETNDSLMGVVETWWEDEKDSDYNQQYNSLMGAVQGSDWFLDNAEPIRDSLILQYTDPAQWEANLETNRFDFKSIASQEGYYDFLNGKNGYWDRMAKEAETGNWSEAQIRTRIVQDGLARPDAPGRGQVKRNMDKILSYANDMLVNMSENEARKYATYMEATGGFYVDTKPAMFQPEGGRKWQGAMTWEGVQDHIQGLAKARWGFVDVDDLAERGMTIADTLGDVRETIAHTLQINSRDVNLMGIGFNNLIRGEKVLGDDRRRFMDIQEAEHWAKKQSRYQITDEFRGDIRDLAGSISQAWGYR